VDVDCVFLAVLQVTGHFVSVAVMCNVKQNLDEPDAFPVQQSQSTEGKHVEKLSQICAHAEKICHVKHR